MIKKITILMIFAFGMLIGSSLTNPALATNAKVDSSKTVSATPNSWTSIPGTNLSYRYGMNSFSAHNTFQVSNSGTSEDNFTQQTVQNVTMNLVNLSSVVFEYFVWDINQTVYTSAGSSTTSFRMDNNSFVNYIDKINSSVTFNYQLFPIAFDNTGVYGVTNDTMIVSTTNEYIGAFPTNNTYIELNDAILNVNITYVISNYAIVISYTPIQNVPVTLRVTYKVYAALAYFNAYNVTYNIQANQWLAQVRDGNRMAMSVSGFKDLEMNYTQVSYSVVNYYIQSSLDVNLTYTANGAPVNFTNYPFALRPAFFQQSGSVSALGVQYINTTSLMASTTAVQAFYAKVSKNLNSTHVDASAFVAWMVSSTPRLFAYKDANLNNQLDLQYDPTTGLQVASGDYIPYVGVLEASSGNAITYQNVNQSYTQKFIGFQGFTNVSQTNNYNDSVVNYNQYHYGVGNVSAPYSFNPYFNTPVNDSNTWVFDFGIGYQNFPVTWVDLTTGNTTIVPMNITYAYEYRINPYLGSASLSPTITYGVIANAGLKAKLAGLSLATMYQSDFLSVATLRATRLKQADQNVTSSVTSNFASLSFSGPQNNFTNVDTGGKANYTLDGITHTTNAAIMNIVSFSATAASANVTTFQSDNQNIAGSAMMQNATLTGVSLHYRKDLILISYPQWSGGQIVHDPTFSAVYQSGPTSPEVTSHTANANANIGQSVTLQWTVYDPDNNPNTYKITDSTGKSVKSGNWYSGETLSYTFTVASGSNTYTMIANDKDGNTVSQTVTITGVQGSGTSSTTLPVTSSTPNNNNPSKGAPGFTFDSILLLSIAGLFVINYRRRKST